MKKKNHVVGSFLAKKEHDFYEFIQQTEQLADEKKDIILENLEEAELKELVQAILFLSAWSTVFTAFIEAPANIAFFNKETPWLPPLLLSSFDGLVKFLYITKYTNLNLWKRLIVFVPYLGFGMLTNEVLKSNNDIKQAIRLFSKYEFSQLKKRVQNSVERVFTKK